MSKKKDEMTNFEAFVTILAFFTIPVIGWWAIIPVFAVVMWVGSNIENRKEKLGYTPYTGYKGSHVRKKWEEPKRDEVYPEPDPYVFKKLALTDHAKRTLAIRHGVISPEHRLNYEELDPIKFKESDENIYVTKFEQLNKSKEFAVALDENKEVILTFYPATNIKGHDAYFKKHKNLDSALKDDLTKSLEDLQQIWLDKIA